MVYQQHRNLLFIPSKNTHAFNGGLINSTYVDGVSLTHGSPREHIWTFASALDECVSEGPGYNCPCILDMIWWTE